MLKVTNVRLPVGEEEATLAGHCARMLDIRPAEILRLRILRKNLDVRDKRRLEYVYTLAIEVENNSHLSQRNIANVSAYTPKQFELPEPGATQLRHRPVIIGAGPAGLFAAYLLAQQGYFPLILERGKPVSERTKDVRAFDNGGPLEPESNYLFGEGGAGTFSDGKLTCRTSSPDVDRVLEIIAECKGKPSVLYEAKPHLGSNRLPAVVKAIRSRIIELGGEFQFSCRLEDLEIDAGRVTAILTSSGRMPIDVVVLAIGHSARDTYEMLLHRGIRIEPKAFQMGVRIEQPQENVTVAQYGTSPRAKLLGPADYSMSVNVGSRDLFTFCMCAGGYVMPSVSQPEHFCTNGMSRSWHESPFANSGLVVTVEPKSLGDAHDPLIGIQYQARIEHKAFLITGRNYFAPIQRAQDFLAQRETREVPRSSYQRGVCAANLWELLPPDLARVIQGGLVMMDRSWHGLFLRDATLVGPESRGSCPVRLVRERETRESIGCSGLYPIGEGAGYAGGIVSAAADGLATAKAIIRRFQPVR